jgi:hypothetical protein
MLGDQYAGEGELAERAAAGAVTGPKADCCVMLVAMSPASFTLQICEDLVTVFLCPRLQRRQTANVSGWHRAGSVLAPAAE